MNLYPLYKGQNGIKLSPNDVADGKIFDTDKYKENLPVPSKSVKAARIKRIAENKACDKCDFTLK